MAIYCDMTYNWGLRSGAAHEHGTGYSSTYWNFTLLGQTKRQPWWKYRREQKTSRLFVIKLLNRLEERGTTVLWKELGFNLHSARYRVIAEPSNREMREEWREYCRKHHIVEGVNYPAPWDVANFAGEFVTPVVDRGEVLKYDEVDALLNVLKPGASRAGSWRCSESMHIRHGLKGRTASHRIHACCTTQEPLRLDSTSVSR